MRLIGLPVPMLPWPHNLFSQHVVSFPTMAEPKTDNICGWEGCNMPHHQNVSMSIRTVHGRGWTIRYYCCDGCKSLHVRKHGRV